jgi:hypothetical protein
MKLPRSLSSLAPRRTTETTGLTTQPLLDFHKLGRRRHGDRVPRPACWPMVSVRGSDERFDAVTDSDHLNPAIRGQLAIFGVRRTPGFRYSRICSIFSHSGVGIGWFTRAPHEGTDMSKKTGTKRSTPRMPAAAWGPEAGATTVR